ncbi:MAG: hypothetical protein ACLFRD_11815 [Nitriliruptoraceae bacterium]
MVAWGYLARTAIKVAPIATTVVRQVDRQLRPHVLAYRLARDVDGYVGRWTSDHGNHYAVFARRDSDVLRVFPPLTAGEVEALERDIDRSALRHHSELTEARVGEAGSRVAQAPGNLAARLRDGRRRGGGEPPAAL